ncbi:carbon starvation induced protein CsiD [Alkalihalobacillus oceani]|uniref:Carbon starvation induced protein CsiD n=1 Tax=Halalkalibacter oceani TaxID=1653776 RepID=A0A9X2DVX0_9BACI|nr:glutarate dioxygenase GlaH [Halalkalibacter oceani]MCM3716517.1 carbon starvation induced protein CsiD [Halalkalibacter oceani]
MSVTQSQTFSVSVHPGHKRIKQITLDTSLVKNFLQDLEEFPVQRLENVPFMRFHVAHTLKKHFGEELIHLLRDTLRDRKTGGFTVGLDEQADNFEAQLKFATAISYSIGIANFDDMSGEYYAAFDVKHSYDSDTFLRKAYRTLELHTDGVFVNQVTDWLLMMKLIEENAEGGESRILHLDDWEEMGAFSNHPLASFNFKYSYAHRKSKNVTDIVYDSIFYNKDNHICMRYNDQCTFPETEAQAEYLKEIQESIEQSDGTISISLPVGQLIMLNNHFWLHGREPFKQNEKLFRRLMRQRGVFANKI